MIFLVTKVTRVKTLCIASPRSRIEYTHSIMIGGRIQSVVSRIRIAFHLFKTIYLLRNFLRCQNTRH